MLNKNQNQDIAGWLAGCLNGSTAPRPPLRPPTPSHSPAPHALGRPRPPSLLVPRGEEGGGRSDCSGRGGTFNCSAALLGLKRSSPTLSSSQILNRFILDLELSFSMYLKQRLYVYSTYSMQATVQAMPDELSTMMNTISPSPELLEWPMPVHVPMTKPPPALPLGLMTKAAPAATPRQAPPFVAPGLWLQVPMKKPPPTSPTAIGLYHEQAPAIPMCKRPPPSCTDEAVQRGFELAYACAGTPPPVLEVKVPPPISPAERLALALAFTGETTPHQQQMQLCKCGVDCKARLREWDAKMAGLQL